MSKIILYTFIILLIILFLIALFYSFYEEEEQEETTEQEREETYLSIMNMTTSEILTFRNKNDFIKTIKQYDTIKYFLKGTEEENTEQLLKWYYPNYKRL